MKERKLVSGGWQANIEYFEDYVIKTPKTTEEISRKVSRYLEPLGRISELDFRIKKMQDGWQAGLDIISRGKIPARMLGNIKIIDGGKIRQKRAFTVQDILEDLYSAGKREEARKIVEKVLDFIVDLWKYGVYEHTSKIGNQFGLVEDEVILLDFGELREDRGLAKKQIGDKKWVKQMTKYSSQEVLDCFSEQIDKKLTLDVFDKNWAILK